MDASAEKNLPQLPPELLALVFKTLPASELRKLRLTCTQWNAIIRQTPALMKKLTLLFNHGLVRRAKKGSSLLEKLLRLKHVGGACFVRMTAVPPPSFWLVLDGLGETLQVLCFKDCTLSAQGILQVLRLTPNLKSFSLETNSAIGLAYHTPTWATFSLARLKRLDLHLTDARFLNLFGQLAPNLRVIKFDGKWKVGEQLIDTLIPLVEARKDTLRKLTLKLVRTSPELLRKIGEIGGLRLTALSLKNCEQIDEETIRDFIPQQPSLQRFKCIAEYYFLSGLLDLMNDHLPMLRCLHIHARFMCGELSRFLERASNLKHLTLNSGSRGDALIADVSSNGNPKLTKLSLTGYYVAIEKFGPFFQQSYNIEHLMIKSCRQPNIADLAATIGELRSLKYLKLVDLKAKTGKLSMKDASRGQWSNLTTLHLRSCDLAIGTISGIIHRSPNLDTVIVEHFKIQDDEVLAICQQLSRLSVLKLIHPRNDLSETSLDNLKKYCHKLSRLEFSIDGKAITEQCRDREFEAALPGVKINLIPRMPGYGGLDWYDSFEDYD